MFIRTKHDPKLGRTRVQIVESIRTGRKVRQRSCAMSGSLMTRPNLRI